MDHAAQLDTTYYGTRQETSGPVTFERQSCHPDPPPLAGTMLLHTVGIPRHRRHGVFLRACCEYTGIHHHCLVVEVRRNGSLESMSMHAAHTDGSLCYPSFHAFVAAKISYFEAGDLPIFIHPALESAERFYSKTPCELGGIGSRERRRMGPGRRKQWRRQED